MTNVQPDRVIDHDATSNSRTQAPPGGAWLKTVALGAAGATAGALALRQERLRSRRRQPRSRQRAGAETNNTSSTPTTLVYGGPEITEGPSVLGVGDAIPASDAPFPANVGGYGNDLVANGVHGSTANALGYGVVAANLAPDAATGTEPAPKGLAVASHARIADPVRRAARRGVRSDDRHPCARRALCRSRRHAVVRGSGDGRRHGVRWVKLAGTTDVRRVPLDHPVPRVRLAQDDVPVNGPLAPNANRVVSLADRPRPRHRRGDSRPTSYRSVPPRPSVNITVSSPTNKNFLAVAAGSARRRPDVAVELGSRSHADRQLDHRAARRRRARSRCSAATRPAAPTSSSTSSATTSDDRLDLIASSPIPSRGGGLTATRRIPPSGARSGGSTRRRTPSAGCG